MPKGVYPHTHVKPREYPADIVAAVRRMYLHEGMTVREVQEALPKGFKAQRIIERYIPERRAAKVRDQRGARNKAWKGARPGYEAAHLRVASLRGPASSHGCIDCPGRAFDWSYNHTAGSAELRDENGRKPYSPNPDDYSPRCRSCHRAFDRAQKEVMPMSRELTSGALFAGY